MLLLENLSKKIFDFTDNLIKVTRIINSFFYCLKKYYKNAINLKHLCFSMTMQNAFFHKDLKSKEFLEKELLEMSTNVNKRKIMKHLQ